MQYRIYIPGETACNDSHLKQRGLEDLCRDSGPDWETVDVGPDGKRGLIARWRTGDRAIDGPDGAPEDFEWVACPPDKDYFVGIHPEHRPGPADLARKQQVPGVLVTLADGRQWSIPTARGIPHKIGIDYETGEQTTVANGRFESFSTRAFRHATMLAERENQLKDLKTVFFGVKLSDKDLQDLYAENMSKWVGISTLDEMDQRLAVSILFDEALEHAIDALSINYRLNRFLILHLQLLEISPAHDHLRDICLAAIEASSIIESLKKNEVGRQTSLLAG